jgi:hypothetical protein
MGHASAAFSLTVYGHLFDADLEALAERLDGQKEGFRSVSRHGSRHERWRRRDNGRVARRVESGVVAVPAALAPQGDVLRAVQLFESEATARGSLS